MADFGPIWGKFFSSGSTRGLRSGRRHCNPLMSGPRILELTVGRKQLTWSGTGGTRGTAEMPPHEEEITMVALGPGRGSLNGVVAARVRLPGIVLLCGRSFSGKSTVAAELARHLRADVVSLDAINAERGLQSGAGLPIQEWARTYELSQSRTLELLRSGGTVVVDDTSSPRFLRDGWRTMAGQAHVPLVLVYLNTPVEVSLERHAANRADRSRMDVADEVLREHLESFEPPTPDEDPLEYSTTAGTLTETLQQIERRLSAANPAG
jgi:predicted kinase